jgi:hypothetical protein
MPCNDEIASVSINNIDVRNFLTIVNSYNIYFLTIAENITETDGNKFDPSQYWEKSILKEMMNINHFPTSAKQINYII